MPRKTSINAHKSATTCTDAERGKAGRFREKYYVPKPERQQLNNIVHEKNVEPTKLTMPQKKDSWIEKSAWES